MDPQETANDRFKRGFGDWFWMALIGATVLHAALFLASPTFGTDDYALTSFVTRSIEIPDRLEMPEPPETIRRPAAPVISDVAMDADVSIPPTTFESSVLDRLPPPRTDRGQDTDNAPRFMPMTVRPLLQNETAVARALQRHYPPMLRDAGIGGTTRVWFFIDEQGRVQETRIHTSSGYDELDQAALQVAEIMEFSPAYNRDDKVPVWVSLDIRFEVH